MPRLINTEARKKVARAQKKANDRLVENGWRHDGLWWISPYTQLRYSKQEALGVEELREWGESDSAFLNDKDHSMWVKKEQDDNALISIEELSRRSRRTLEIKRLAVVGCYG